MKLKAWLKQLFLRYQQGTKKNRLHPETIIYHCQSNSQATTLFPQSSRSNALPNDFTIPPANYTVASKTYNFTQPGIYRYFNYPKHSIQKWVPAPNLEENLSALSWLYCYGNKHDNLTEEEIRQHITKDRAQITCTHIALLVKHLLKTQQINARLVGLFRTQKQNNYDNGHTLLEIQTLQKSWQLYDPTYLCFFTEEKSKRYLSAIELKNQITANTTFELHFLQRNCYPTPFNYLGTSMDFWAEQKFFDAQALKNWYLEVTQTLLLQDEHNNWHTAEKAAQKILPNNTTIMSQNAFKQNFYPEKT